MPAALPARAVNTKNIAKPEPEATASPTSAGVTTIRSPGGGVARLTSAMASSAQLTPTSWWSGGRSPAARPTTTGIAAEVTAVTGATTVIAP